MIPFEAAVQAIAEQICELVTNPGDVEVTHGALKLQEPAKGKLLRVVFVWTGWAPPAMSAAVGPNVIGEFSVTPLYHVPLRVMAFITGPSLGAANDLWMVVLNAAYAVLGDYSKPVEGEIPTQLEEQAAHIRGGAELLVQPFEWSIEVPKLSETARVTIITAQVEECELVGD